MTQAEWQKSLKPGDEVHVYGMYRDEICKVDKVTPSGRVTAGGYQFNSNGDEIGANGMGRHHINEVTEYTRQHIQSIQLINYLNNYHFSDLPLEKLEQIKAIIDQS